MIPPQSTVALVMTLPAWHELGVALLTELLDEVFELLDDFELLLEEDFELLDEDGPVLDDELLAVAVGTEHSLTPPATLPPKVASLQTKLPVSTL
ncbi:hypothetical protein VVD49_17910 [Uliginosibacterium sp. H3]|uniref:Secreted protein n=1 Tax=Uliginosibacterium silvisoli TaxID=3114758 RepID=A0ABU6K992_9RHOO|nr:hypothetical protein [Uliginosibacterium sp. H3]